MNKTDELSDKLATDLLAMACGGLIGNMLLLLVLLPTN